MSAVSLNARRLHKAPRERASYSSCGGKHRYGTVHEADRVARRCMDERGGALRVYDCRGCGGWHITSRADRRML